MGKGGVETEVFVQVDVIVINICVCVCVCVAIIRIASGMTKTKIIRVYIYISQRLYSDADVVGVFVASSSSGLRWRSASKSSLMRLS